MYIYSTLVHIYGSICKPDTQNSNNENEQAYTIYIIILKIHTHFIIMPSKQDH